MIYDETCRGRGLLPGLTHSWIAGALLYTRYNPLVRFVMRRISRANGGPTDTSRDYEFTDWSGLDKLVDETLGDAPADAPAEPVAPSP